MSVETRQNESKRDNVGQELNKLEFVVIYTHLELRYEMSHTITSHHVHHFHQTRIRQLLFSNKRCEKLW